MFMDRKTQHCQHVTSSQPDLWIFLGTKTQKKLSYRYKQSDSNLYTEKQKTWNGQYNTEE